ncbi:hypothetical protein [Mycobacterium sp.]|uniref:hypothetical protein n=1 Tax=Mycobacterium sp. TaxID=1785 RepID=UPI00262E6E58|nr:hypothetical protein [Mycobacterium sp.]
MTTPDKQPEIEVIDKLAVLINVRNATFRPGPVRMGKSGDFQAWLDGVPMIPRPTLDELSRDAFAAGQAHEDPGER